MLLRSLLLVPLALTPVAGAVPGLVFHEEQVFGAEPDLIGQVTDVEVAPDGTVYVLDSGFETIHRFGPDGAYRGGIGRAGEGPGEFYRPFHLALGPSGRLYVAGGSSSIAVIDPDGTPVRSIHVPEYNIIRSLVVAADQSVFFVSHDRGSRTLVHHIAPAGDAYEPVGSFSPDYAVGTDLPLIEVMTASGGILQPGPEGTVLFLQWAPMDLRAYTAEGRLLWERRLRETLCPMPERPERTDRGLTFRVPTMATTLIRLPDGRLLTRLSVMPEEDDGERTSYLDLWTAEGEFLAGARDPEFSPRCADARGFFYAAQERDGTLVVVRLSMDVTGE